MAQVVVTHWVHPEVVSYLARFCEPLVPSAAEGVWPGARVAELAATAAGLTILPGLLSHPRTLFTPHLGSAVNSVRRDMSLEAARQVEQALSGQRPDHAVNDPHAPGV